jgi:hypothetical protein
MQSTALLGQVLSVVAGRVNAGSDVSLGSTWQRSALASGRAAHSVDDTALGGVALLLVSLLALLAAGGAAGWVARHLVRRSAPELIVLLNQSASFYGRWPEDRLARAPRKELMAEAARCRRIVELLERRVTPGDVRVAGEAGSVEGLRAWIALVSSRIDGRIEIPSGPAYA